jgi:hypothetical protein
MPLRRPLAPCFAALLLLACGGAPKNSDQDADPAADGGDAADGATDGGSSEGATDDGATDGASDGGSDDGAIDGSSDDGAADGASDGTTDGTTDGATDGADTAAPPCAEGLQISVLSADLSEATPLEPGASLPLGPARAGTRDRSLALSLHNPCDSRLRFLGHPDDWVSGEGVRLLDLPPVLLEPGDSATLRLGWTPGLEGARAGHLSLPHDQTGSPFTLELAVETGPPLRLVLVGEGRRVSSTADYGLSFLQDDWSTLTAHTNALQRGACHGSAGFLAVGGSDQRNLWLSPTGEAWLPVTDGPGWIGDCAFGEGVYVAAGGGGVLARSADGLSWTQGGTSGGAHLRAIAYGDGVFVAVGADRRVVSDDGLTIDLDLTVAGASTDRVAFGETTDGDRIFVTVGAAGRVATSADQGRTWSEQTVGSGGGFESVVFTGEAFVISDGSAIYRSFDGYAWALLNASTVRPLAGLGGQVWGAQGDALMRSEDGAFRWTSLRAADGGPGYLDAALETEE